MITNKPMDTYGKVLRRIKFEDGDRKWYDETLLYEAAVIDNNDVQCLYLRVTDYRFVDEYNHTPEYYGTHFNCKENTEHFNNWLAWVVGEFICTSIHRSNERTLRNVKEKANSLLSAMDINLNFGT